MRPVLKPLVNKPLTFWFSGGDIIWRGDGRCTPIDREQAESLRGIYGDEADAAWIAGDRDLAKQAAGLWMELTRALDSQAMWFRAVGREPQRWAA